MALCIYCGERVGIICDDCASSAKERDEMRFELEKLRKICAEEHGHTGLVYKEMYDQLKSEHERVLCILAKHRICKECGHLVGFGLFNDLKHKCDHCANKEINQNQSLPMTNRQAHEEAAGMNLHDSFFTFNKINPDAPYVTNH